MKYTASELIKKYKNKYIKVYPYFYDKKDEDGRWITLYEVLGVKNKIEEDYNLPEDCIV